MDVSGAAAVPAEPVAGGAPADDDYGSFLDEMEELGLLSDLEDELPPDFSAVFEIGRIVADPRSEVARALDPALELRRAGAADEVAPESDDSESRIEVPAAEEYEAEFIRSWGDVRSVYAWQWLLPEEVFLRRLAQRTLWFPLARAPLIRAIEEGGDAFVPTPTKQRVHVLFDTSASMALHFRFALAKAVVLRFLRRNRREMGEICLRTFDVDVGPLEDARDPRTYDTLLRRVARRRTLGNGTCLEKAILTACADIRERRGLSGAEILVVTDGAAHLDEPRVREALGSDVELHCVKIGSAEVYAADKWIADRIDYSKREDTRRDQRILQLRSRTDRLKEALAHATDPSVRRGIEHGLAECEEERRAIAEELRQEYGHEIERLAHVYVQIPDVDPAWLALSPERLASLERLVRDALRRLGAAPAPPTLLKEAALLLSHVAMLGGEQTDPDARARLEALRQALEQRIGAAVEHHEAHVLDAGLLSQTDQKDLRILLRRGTSRGSSLWLALLRYFYAWVVRIGRKR